MKKVIISPYSKRLISGDKCAKDYPYWSELVSLMKDDSHHIIQIGISGEDKIDGVDEVLFDLSLNALKDKLKSCDYWISVDSFFHHFAALHGVKGVVIFSKSNPAIFGHHSNINVFKDEVYFRKNQFDYWSSEPFDKESFLDPLELYGIIKKEFP